MRGGPRADDVGSVFRHPKAGHMTPPVTQLDAVVPAAIVMPERIPTAGEAGGGHAWAFAKRAFDIGFSAFLVLLLSPLLLIVTIAIKLGSRGPVLFRQRRLGRDLQPFTVLKFRTMDPGASPAAHKAYIAELASMATATATG